MLRESAFAAAWLQDHIGLGEQINEFCNSPTDIAELADESQIRLQSNPRFEPTRQNPIAANGKIPYRFGKPGDSTRAVGTQGD